MSSNPVQVKDPITARKRRGGKRRKKEEKKIKALAKNSTNFRENNLIG